MRSLILIAPLALAACATTATEPPMIDPPAGPGICSPANLGRFAGRPATAELGAEMLSTSGARTIRWVPHNGVITMDLREDRLTVWLTPDNHVGRATCT